MRRNFTVVYLLVLLCSNVVPAASQPAASFTEARTARYFDSIREDPNLLVAFLLQMPKGGDLHSHLAGAIYAETLIDWAGQQNACVDPTTYYLTPSLKLATNDPYCPAPTVLAETARKNTTLYRGMIDAYSMRNWQTFRPIRPRPFLRHVRQVRRGYARQHRCDAGTHGGEGGIAEGDLPGTDVHSNRQSIRGYAGLRGSEENSVAR